MTLMIATVTITTMTFPSELIAETFNIETAITKNIQLTRKFLAMVSKNSPVLDEDNKAMVRDHLKHLEGMLSDSDLGLEYFDVECNKELNDDKTAINLETFKTDVLACLLVDAHSENADSFVYARFVYMNVVEEVDEKKGD